LADGSTLHTPFTVCKSDMTGDSCCDHVDGRQIKHWTWWKAHS